MQAGQKERVNGIELLFCPFPVLNITQGSDIGSHLGTKAIDVNAGVRGLRAPYYAPATIKCVWQYPSNGQYMWQTKEDVRCPNGYIGRVTFMVAHDTDQHWVGQEIAQGERMGCMSDIGQATGVHAHIESEQGYDRTWQKNNYGIYNFLQETYADDCWFMDGTEIQNGMSGNWRNSDILPEKSKHGNPVERNENQDQIEIHSDIANVRARTAPNGEIIGYMNAGIYNSIERQEQEGYTWHKVEEGLWFAEGEWATFYPKKEEPTPEPEPEPIPDEKEEDKKLIAQFLELMAKILNKLFGIKGDE